jgi:CarboxypepD_reg-like domain
MIQHRSAIGARSRRPGGIALAALLLALVRTSAGAQEVRGRVVIDGWAEAGSGAEVTLLDDALAPLATVRADDAGRFVFPELAAGAYHVQAALAGQSSALSPALVLGAGADTAEVELLVPSPLLVAALACLAEGAGEPTSVLVGTAYETGTRLPIPRATVLVAWEGGSPGSREVRADADGRYVLCGAPAGPPVRASVVALGRVGAPGPRLVLEPGSITRQDVGLDGGVRVLSVESAVRRTDAAGGPARVGGRVVDAESGEPVANAAVRLGTADAALTDGTGRFLLVDVRGGEQMLEVDRLGYGTQSTKVNIEGGTAVDLTVRMAARPVELGGIDVATARSAMSRGDPQATISTRVLAGAELQAATERGTRIADLVRDRFPLSVREGNFVTTENDLPRGMVCIEGRRADRLTIVIEDFALPAAAAAALRGFAFCDMILVVIDGNAVPGGGDVLLGITAADFESVEYMPPIEAGARYGLHAGIQGALVLWTRGRGPHARRER